MQTTDLIDRLAAGLTSDLTTRGVEEAYPRTVGRFCGRPRCGVLSLGLGNDFAAMLLTSSVWMKWAYALAVSAAALSLCVRLARPEGAPVRCLSCLEFRFSCWVPSRSWR